MFVLVILEDKIKIAPEKFDQDNTDMILAEIDQKFINRVGEWESVSVSVSECVSVWVCECECEWVWVTDEE